MKRPFSDITKDLDVNYFPGMDPVAGEAGFEIEISRAGYIAEFGGATLEWFALPGEIEIDRTTLANRIGESAVAEIEDAAADEYMSAHG